MYEQFGRFVSLVRRQRGVTVEELAQRCDVSVDRVRQWEDGQSMPDEELLCCLADALEVNVPELEQGQYLYGVGDEEDTDKKPVAALPITRNTKWRRLAAITLDFAAYAFLRLLAAVAVGVSGASDDVKTALLLISSTIFSACLLYWRDWIWGGRSLGKRVMKLTVVNVLDGETPAKWCLAIRSMFIGLGWIEGVVFLTNGRTIADYVMNTAVVRETDVVSWKRQLSPPDEEHASQERRRVKKRLIGIGAGLAAFFVLVATVVTISLQSAKRSTEYETAYTYFTQSDTFEQLSVDEQRVRLTGVSSGVQHDARTCIFTFEVKWRSYEVVCHQIGADLWIVCEECTTIR